MKKNTIVNEFTTKNRRINLKNLVGKQKTPAQEDRLIEIVHTSLRIVLILQYRNNFNLVTERVDKGETIQLLVPQKTKMIHFQLGYRES